MPQCTREGASGGAAFPFPPFRSSPVPSPRLISWPEFGTVCIREGCGGFFGQGEETQTSAQVLPKENSSGVGFKPSEAGDYCLFRR